MKNVRLVCFVSAVAMLPMLVGCSLVAAQRQTPAVPAREPTAASGRNTTVPSKLEPTRAAAPGSAFAPNDAPAADIQLPSGFRAFVFVDGLNRPTALTFASDNRLYVGQQNGSVLSFTNQKGIGTDQRQVASVSGTLLGIAFRPGTRDLYLSTTGRVLVARGSADGSFGQPQLLAGDLPTGRHQNDHIAFSLDGRFFFIGIGSTCDACAERDSRSASVMRMSADGSQQQVFARGLRNPFGLAVHPQTGELFATDNGRDVPVGGVPDELNLVVENGHYGWPDCWGHRQGSRCENTLAPVAEFQDHSSADGFAFYAGSNFPEEYRGNAFVALWGGNVPVPTIGKRVERVVLAKANDQWQGTVSTFASGFDHPIAVAVSPQDGALYVADHGSGKIYRIVWEGG